MLFEYNINTKSEQFYDVTDLVRKALRESGVKNGICTVFCPHTTAGITINENADTDVGRDLLYALGKSFSVRKTLTQSVQ